MTDEGLLDVIRTQAGVAAEALSTLPPLSSGKPRTAAAYNAAAELVGQDPAEFWLVQLQTDGLVRAFEQALLAQGVAVAKDEDEATIEEEAEGWIGLDTWTRKASAFRCRIFKNGEFSGSGVLVGPRLVLTAWHVIAQPGADGKPVAAKKLHVELSDKTKLVAGVPAAWESPCGDDEFHGIAPTSDADVVDRNDVAVLAMPDWAGTHLGFVPLAMPPPRQRARSAVAVVGYPGGKEAGIVFGEAARIKDVKARWQHDAKTVEGSSGGGVFNRRLEFIGVHQGKYDKEKRYVPLDRFLTEALKVVQADVAPLYLWSLDDTTDGKLVVGRDLFFETVAVAGEASKRVRGIRIKRTDISTGAGSLAFSFDILDELLRRRGPDYVLVRVTLDEIRPDLIADMRERVRAKGFPIPEPESEPGVAPGQAPPETTAKDRAAILAAAVEAAATKLGKVVWFFFDNPTVAFLDNARFGFEGFVEAALVQPHLRLVIAGYETLSLPGTDFAGAAPPEGDRKPGLVMEFLGGFHRSDLVKFMTAAARVLVGEPKPGTIDTLVGQALAGLPNINDTYADELLPAVLEKLRAGLEFLEGQGPQP